MEDIPLPELLQTQETNAKPKKRKNPSDVVLTVVSYIFDSQNQLLKNCKNNWPVKNWYSNVLFSVVSYSKTKLKRLLISFPFLIVCEITWFFENH